MPSPCISRSHRILTSLTVNGIAKGRYQQNYPNSQYRTNRHWEIQFPEQNASLGLLNRWVHTLTDGSSSIPKIACSHALSFPVLMDNLIAENKAKPMIIVMDNLKTVKPGEDAGLYHARSIIARLFMADVPPPIGAPRPSTPGATAPRPGFPANWFNTFSDMMITDLMPMVEKTYRVAPGRENRAMAGLSMGGMQSFQTALAHLDKFAYLGGFSGSSGGFGSFDTKTAHNGVMADAAAFNKKMKVLFLGIGTAEGPGAKTFSERLTKAGIENIYFESPGTAHEWLTWRRCLNDFAPRLFR